MKAVSLWQPWASLWVAGIKRNETRSWRTNHRGTLMVHAAKMGVLELYRRIGWEAAGELSRVLAEQGLPSMQDLPRGCIVGSVELIGWLETGLVHPTALEDSVGDYTPGRIAWMAARHRALTEPIPCKGHQGIWRVPDELQALISSGRGFNPVDTAHAARTFSEDLDFDLPGDVAGGGLLSDAQDRRSAPVARCQ